MNSERTTDHQALSRGGQSSFFGASFPLAEASDELRQSLESVRAKPELRSAIILRQTVEGVRHVTESIMGSDSTVKSRTWKNPDTSDTHFFGQMSMDVTYLNAMIQTNMSQIEDENPTVSVRISPATLKNEERLHDAMMRHPSAAKAYGELKSNRRTYDLSQLSNLIEGGIASIGQRDTLARRHLTLQTLTLLLTHVREIVDVFKQKALVPKHVPKVTQQSDVATSELIHHFEAHIPAPLRTVMHLMQQLIDVIRSIIERRNALNPRMDVLSNDFQNDVTDIWLCVKDIMKKLEDVPGALDELAAVVTFDPRLGMPDFLHTRAHNEMIKTREQILGVVGSGLEIIGTYTSIASLLAML